MIDKLITLLVLIAEALRRWQRAREQRKHDDDVDELRKNPGEWFDNHFGGVLPDDADKTDKAGAEHDRKQ